MNMNTNEISSLSFLGSLGATPAVNANANTSVEPADATGFQDLLALVGDLQVADDQSGQQSEFIDQSLQAMQTNEMKNPVSGQMAQLQLLPMMMGKTTSIGPQANPLAEMPSLKSENGAPVDLADVMSRGLQSQIAWSEKQPPSAVAPDPAAVEEWSRAILSGDLKSVELLPEAETLPSAKATLPSYSALSAQDMMAPSALSALPRASKATPIAGMPEAATVPNGKGIMDAPVAMDGFKPWVPQAATVENAKPILMSAVVSEAKNAKGTKSADDHSPVAMSGADFVLQQGLASKGAAGGSAANLTLVGATQLGESQDLRIAPEALNFVADRIQALRAQGGGQLKVALNPVELGGVEIRVSMKQGNMEVQLLAERPETMQALGQAKAELAVKLDQIRPTQISVDNLTTASTPTSALNSWKTASTDDLLKTKNVLGAEVGIVRKDFGLTPSSSSLVSDLSTATKADPLRVRGAEDTRSAFGGAGGEWNREERREKARGQWQESFEAERHSA